MIQKIIDGIILALRYEFPGVDVYQEQIKQGLVEPCFLVRCVSASEWAMVGTRYRRGHLMSVQYIADSETDAKSECYAVHDRLYAALNYISCGDSMLRGVMMSGEVLDGVLTFTVTYNVFVRRVPEVEPMETLTVENTA